MHFKQTHHYSESWPTVTLAFFLRYPNPYAAHVLSCDVLSRTPTPQGTLLTTRLILKRGAVPKWLPTGIVSRAESWIVEESEVDPVGRVVRCTTKNLDHVKIMSVRETVVLRENAADSSTIQTTEARVVSQFGWGLAKRIERYGHEKFQKNLEKSRAGISLILSLLHQSRLQAQTALAYQGYPISATGTVFDSFRPSLYVAAAAVSGQDSRTAAAMENIGVDERHVTPPEGGGSGVGGASTGKWNPLSWIRRS